MRGPLLIFASLWFDIYTIIFWLSSEQLQDYIVKKEEFEKPRRLACFLLDFIL
jgi:hypothetical protein